jgi:iron complex outermembrane receptor protein
MADLGLPAFTLPVNANNRSRWTSVEFQHRYAPAAGTRLSWGAELRRESLRSPSFFYNKEMHRRDTARAFLNAEWRFAPEWLLNGSAMAERVSGLPTRVAPRAFLIWQPAPDLNLRLGYTRAYHQPTLFEQRADARIVHPSLGLLQRRHIADPGIRAQRIDVLEGGLLVSDNRFGALDVRVFHETVSNLIRRVYLAAPPANGPGPTAVESILGSSSWQNHPRRVRLRGIESEWHSRRHQGAQLILTHSMVHASGGSGVIRRGVASHTASLTWLQDWNGWHSSATLSRRGRMDASTGFVPGYQYIVPALTQLDVSVWREMRFGDHKGELRLTGINLLGRQQEVAFNPVQITTGRTPPNRASRSVYASVSLQF